MFDSQMPPTIATQQNVPSWQEMANEKRERIPSAAGSSLLQRGIDNVGDRRGRQENHPMSMFNKLDLDLPRVNNNPQPAPLTNHLSSGLLSSVGTPKSEEAGPAQMPDLLPSFWNREGYHNPNEMAEQSTTTDLGEFNSPDTLLGNIDNEGNAIESLVASARRENNSQRQLPRSEITPLNQNSRLRKKTSANNSRLVKRAVNPTNSPRRGRLVPALSNAVRDLGSTITNRIMSTLEETAPQSPNLRERADEAQQDELETFRTLAQSNGGVMPDEKARELEENVRRRKAIIEQNEQEFAESNDDFSFTDLIDSDAHKSSTAGKGGLPRIDL